MVNKGYVMNVMSSVSLWLTSTLTLSLGAFYILGPWGPIRSDSTSNVSYINPQSGMFSCQLLPLAQKRSKHLASQKLETDHVEDWVPNRGVVDSSQSYEEVEPSHLLSVYHITRKSALEGGFASACDSCVLRVQQHYTQVCRCMKGFDGWWSPSDFTVAHLCVLQEYLKPSKACTAVWM